MKIETPAIARIIDMIRPFTAWSHGTMPEDGILAVESGENQIVIRRRPGRGFRLNVQTELTELGVRYRARYRTNEVDVIVVDGVAIDSVYAPTGRIEDVRVQHMHPRGKNAVRRRMGSIRYRRMLEAAIAQGHDWARRELQRVRDDARHRIRLRRRRMTPEQCSSRGCMVCAISM